MVNTPAFIPVPPGYIVLPIADYDNLIEQRVAARNDFIDELAEKDKEIARLKDRISEIETERMKWHTKYIDATTESGRHIRERDEAIDNRNKLAVKLQQANETVMDLKKELHTLYEELCRTDEIEEIKHAVAES